MQRGIGIVGAGPGVSALHLPTLARLSDEFAVVHISDNGGGRAAELAARVGARSSSGIADLLADDRVEVVVLCSPPAEHASQILASIAAGKRAILCEKPLATTIADAEAVIDACRETGTALLVGTNHFYDPAWGRVKHHLLAGSHAVRSISVTLALPPNDRYHAVVTEMPGALTAPGRSAPDLTVPAIAASVVRQLVTGLAVHELPLIRDLAPVLEDVVFARAVAPVGYVLGFRASGIPVRMATVMMPDGADALWRVEITTDADLVEIVFPPAFVHVGGAEVHVWLESGRRTSYPADDIDGYITEWRALADVLDGASVIEYGELLDDARYAITLADAAAAVILQESAA